MDNVNEMPSITIIGYFAHMPGIMVVDDFVQSIQRVLPKCWITKIPAGFVRHKLKTNIIR